MLHDKDRVIIHELRRGARSKLTQLSEQTGIPVSTLHDRLKKLKQKQRIRLVSLPDYKQLLLPLQCWVFVRANDREYAREQLQDNPHINTLLAVNNGADFAIEAVFSDFAQYDTFLTDLQSLGTVTDHPVIKEVCKETARVAT